MSTEPITHQDIRLYASIVVSVVVLAIAAIVILSKAYPTDDVKWAFGAVGLVFGYWAK
ncbi:MAG: hypothetical protein WA855_02495 [Candidatus Acidiferrales bacterium]